MNALIESWAKFVVARRYFVIIITLLLVPLMLLTGRAIPFDNTTERYFVEGDPTLVDFEYLIDLFGDYEYLIVGVEAIPQSDDIFQVETLRAISALTEFFDSHQYVTQVRSLTNYQYTHADGDDLSTDYLVDDINSLENNPNAIATIKAIIADEEMAIGTLITEDFKHSRITARVEYRNDTAAHKVELAQDFYQFMSDENMVSENYILHYSGYPLLSERFETLAQEDLAILIPVMGVLMLLMLYISFRSIVAVVLPGIVIGIGVLSVNEIQSYLGSPHTTVDQALLPTMIIIGIGITVHVMLEFYHFLGKYNDGKTAAEQTVVHLWKPALFTAITTSAGFCAMSIIKIAPIKDFAILGTIGPMVLFLFALTLLPALLSFVSYLPDKTRMVLSTGFITRVTNKLPDFTLEHRNFILACGGLCLVFALYAVPKIQIDTNYVNFFKENSVTRQDILYLDEEFKGVMTLDVILDSGEVDGIKDPRFLQKVEEFQAWLEVRDPIGPVNSLVDYLKQINQALNRDDPTYYRLPDSREMTAQFLLLYESSGANEDLSDIKDFDDRYVRIVAPIINMRASETEEELQLIRSYLENNYSELDPLLTGSMVLKTAQDVYAAEGMSRAFGIALLVIIFFFICLFRSFKYGLLSIIPSILPIILTGAIAGIAGVFLDLSTMLVGAMTMGIAVDDSIHVMNRYLIAKEDGASTKEAIASAMQESGRAVVFSSMVLVLGFSVFGLASFTTIVYVGLFGSLIMFLALLGDLLLLPAILYWVDGADNPESAIESDLLPETKG